MEKMMNYSWPGNVRELENIVERTVILSSGKKLVIGDWFSSSSSIENTTSILTMSDIERKHIIVALEKTGWRISGEKGAAKLLDMKPTTLESRMKKLGIQRKS
jgi:transcriptional regulator with GAF, ATPase, and Fis domain